LATKEQYEFFRSLYEAEERTYEQLEGRAKVYLGVVTAFLATVLVKASDVVESAKALNVPWWSILAEAILLTIVLTLILFALRIRAYEAVNDGEEIIEEFGENIPSDEEFFDDRIADYAVAASRNLRANNETATFLAWASRLLVASMVGLMGIFLTAVRNLQ
jgi:hypothetical protein